MHVCIHIRYSLKHLLLKGFYLEAPANKPMLNLQKTFWKHPPYTALVPRYMYLSVTRKWPWHPVGLPAWLYIYYCTPYILLGIKVGSRGQILGFQCGCRIRGPDEKCEWARCKSMWISISITKSNGNFVFKQHMCVIYQGILLYFFKAVSQLLKYACIQSWTTWKPQDRSRLTWGGPV